MMDVGGVGGFSKISWSVDNLLIHLDVCVWGIYVANSIVVEIVFDMV